LLSHSQEIKHLDILYCCLCKWHFCCCAQEKVLAQVEAEKAAAPPKPAKAEKPAPKAGAEAEEEEEEEEEENPVEKALTKYGIITENPWEPGVKWVPLS
jgi:hypothetical protein